MRRKKGDRDTPSARTDGRVSPNDIQQVEFRLAFRGYNERDVDAFLDRVTEDLAYYIERSEGAGTGSSLAGAATSSSTEDARREAEAIVARAREEAAAMLRDAEREAAGARSGASGGDPRAAVGPFLNKEREFLQSLGGLVQSHAEEIKDMVLAVRARAERAPEPEDDLESEPSAAEAPAAESEPAESEAATAAEIRERLGEPAPTDRVEVVTAVPHDEQAELAPEGAQAGEGRERSLRELFWGDD